MTQFTSHLPSDTSISNDSDNDSITWSNVITAPRSSGKERFRASRTRTMLRLRVLQYYAT